MKIQRDVPGAGRRKRTSVVSAGAIARMADQGKDISHFFTGEGRIVHQDRSDSIRPDPGPTLKERQ